MYKKNLTEKMNLRLTPSQVSFLADLATVRHCSCSDVLRSILDFYILEWEVLAHGDNSTDIDGKL